MSHFYCPFICAQIEEIAKPFILDWVISQHSHILEWTGRAFDIEVSLILPTKMLYENGGVIWLILVNINLKLEGRGGRKKALRSKYCVILPVILYTTGIEIIAMVVGGDTKQYAMHCLIEYDKICMG